MGEPERIPERSRSLAAPAGRERVGEVTPSVPRRLTALLPATSPHRPPRTRRLLIAVYRTSGHAALRAATLARICRVEGGYARPDLPQMARSPNGGAIAAVGYLARRCSIRKSATLPRASISFSRLVKPCPSSW